MIFHVSDFLVRRSGLPEHRSIGDERGVYDRVARRAGITLNATVIENSLARWHDGAIDLSGALQEIANSHR